MAATCQAATRNKQRCGRRIKDGETYCWQHKPSHVRFFRTLGWGMILAAVATTLGFVNDVFDIRDRFFAQTATAVPTATSVSIAVFQATASPTVSNSPTALAQTNVAPTLPAYILPFPSRVPTSEIAYDKVSDVFPMFAGATWTYSFVRSVETWDGQTQSIQQISGYYVEQVLFVETGVADYVQVIGVRQTGENFFDVCSRQYVTAGELDVWYVVDEHRLYRTCSKNEANAIANGIRYESENGDSPLLNMPQYVVPFVEGHDWAAFPDIPPRDDKMYRWHVDAETDISVPVGKYENCFRIALYTLPDTTIRWVCSGVGLVASEYHHRGAVDDYRAELMSLDIRVSP